MSDSQNAISENKIAERRMDNIIGNLLRFGVLLTALFVLIGGILYLFKYGKDIPQYHLFHSEPEDLRTLGGVLRDFISFDPRGIIQFGILILIMTPVARVAFSIFAFAHERDWIYVTITLFVLAALAFSLSGGHF